MNLDSNGTPALVVAAFGRRGRLESSDGSIHRFVVKGRRLSPVCGDNVHWEQPQNSQEALVTGICPRDNALERADARGRRETVAANLGRLVVVVAAQPAPDLFLVDRFLCAAALIGSDSAIVYNKSDLPPDDALEQELNNYRHLGYPVVQTSANTAGGTSELAELLAGQTSMLVGQSGVGKSSLINALAPDAEATVGELSAATAEGKHTTSASIMHRLNNGARIIDSPGVREFAPYVDESAAVQSGFPEILAAAENCRFTNCAHIREPDCAVKQLSDSGKIQPRRYESYKRLKQAALTAQP